MKPFQFSLQAVMTVRASEERKALEAFSLAQAQFEKIAAWHREIQKQIEDVFDSRREILRKAVSSQEVQIMQQGLRALQETLQRCRLEMQKAQVILTEKSRVLLEARQKREVIEKLREKQLASYLDRVAKAEQKTADDFATLKSIGNLALKWR